MLQQPALLPMYHCDKGTTKGGFYHTIFGFSLTRAILIAHINNLWSKPMYLFICYNCFNPPLWVTEMCRKNPANNLISTCFTNLALSQEVAVKSLLITFWSEFTGLDLSSRVLKCAKETMKKCLGYRF